MTENAFNKFYWGFLFIMIDFRLQGVDILPDVIGYCLFAAGFTILALKSICFEKARSLNVFMIILSIFQIYERPAKSSGINFGILGPFGFLIGIAGAILDLLVMYNLFMGIKEVAGLSGHMDISEKAERRWNQYLMLELASLFSIILLIIPPIAVIYVLAFTIISIVFAFIILGFMKRCGFSL